ncbi:hypothetical protein HGP16_31345 [Rhizobium sp. P40RR-XXII]|uniref:hypothetical protein n=1 Tax=unclassified Rhizobium TaxID=2613769 RepID=UPI00145651E7|nr:MULTISPECIES: hypothetical protein [unclassified Rhizobium]NLR89182.1 hypothetical protein [Rhizobium sp. P28RR-XV]NLS21000.1 hypothetical protein [Rhizobium sp. P40RR-XXII]
MWKSNPNIENLRKIRNWLVTLRQEIASSTVAENDFSKIDDLIDAQRRIDAIDRALNDEIRTIDPDLWNKLGSL